MRWTAIRNSRAHVRQSSGNCFQLPSTFLCRAVFSVVVVVPVMVCRREAIELCTTTQHSLQRIHVLDQYLLHLALLSALLLRLQLVYCWYVHMSCHLWGWRQFITSDNVVQRSTPVPPSKLIFDEPIWGGISSTLKCNCVRVYMCNHSRRFMIGRLWEMLTGWFYSSVDIQKYQICVLICICWFVFLKDRQSIRFSNSFLKGP